jgi:hypothetical protein
MAQSFTGSCACGAIRFECSAEPVAAFNCHCRDCQRVAGGPFITAIAVTAAAVKITGQPKYHTVKGESGNSMSRGFCSECGAQLIARSSGRSDMIGIHLTALDDPNRYEPTMDIWTSSAPKWDCMNPALQKLPKGLPPH